MFDAHLLMQTTDIEAFAFLSLLKLYPMGYIKKRQLIVILD